MNNSMELFNELANPASRFIKFPKIQILTIDDLLNNKKPDVPLITVPYYKEAKAAKNENRNRELGI